MRIQSVNQNNYSNFKKQQNFGMFKVSGLVVQVDDLPVENTHSRRVVKELIDKVVGTTADAGVRNGIGDSIQGLAEQDACCVSADTTNISHFGIGNMLRIKKTTLDGREAVTEINLDPADIAKEADRISPHILKDLRRAEVTEADLASAGIDPRVIDWAVG